MAYSHHLPGQRLRSLHGLVVTGQSSWGAAADLPQRIALH